MMNNWRTLLLAGALVALASPAMAMDSKPANDSIWIGSYGSLDNWTALGKKEIILWTSPSRPYLVTVRRPLHGMRFANAIGVTSTAGRVTKFDSVIVDGFRAPIESIQAIDKETAKLLKSQASK